MTPTARSLDWARRHDLMAGVVERWNRFGGAKKLGADGRATPTGIRQDLFGFIDLVVIDALPGTLAVQACATGDQSKRLAKIASPEIRPRAVRWLGAGNRIEVWGWAKRGPRGKQKRWERTVTEVTLHTLTDLARAEAHLADLEVPV